MASDSSSSLLLAIHFLKNTARLLAKHSEDSLALRSIALAKGGGNTKSFRQGCPATIAALTNSSGDLGIPQADTNSESLPPLAELPGVTLSNCAPLGKMRSSLVTDGGRVSGPFQASHARDGPICGAMREHNLLTLGNHGWKLGRLGLKSPLWR